MTSSSKKHKNIGEGYSPRIIHNSTASHVKSFKNLSPVKKTSAFNGTRQSYCLPPSEDRVKVQREPSNDKERVAINTSSGSIVDQKKQRIFDKVWELLLTDTEKSFLPLIHPATANYRSVPFPLMELLIDVFTDFEAE